MNQLLFLPPTARQVLFVAVLAFCVLVDCIAAADPLNTNTSVKYIGSENCRECHSEQHRTYLQTAHSRSMEKVDPDKEGAATSFRHELSGNDYDVLHQNNQLIHREVIRGVDDEKLATSEHRITYTIGSGAHGKSYVYQTGSFLGQSPLSWYEDTQKWGMSPGYDLPYHSGFGRKLNSECFFCHVGSIDRKVGNPNDFAILEETVGCERCHGPGELHAAKYRRNPKPTGPDNTIVNPANLSRTLSEAICQQCHLQAAGKSLVSGKDEWDFRPGLPLTDFRIDYQYRLGDDTMRVVGHVEQLHMSECYKQTENLTCITCHDPHHTPAPESAVEHYRAICLNCHDDDSCGKPHQARVDLANNDCSLCHMPKKDTEVPHTAFRHHRIGIHHDVKPRIEVIAGLTPVLDISKLTSTEVARCEALAKFQVAQAEPDSPSFRDYGIDAAKALIQIKNAGKADSDANAILAMLARAQGQRKISQDLASEVVETEKIPSRARVEALRLLAQLAYERRDYAEAVKYYQEITTYQQEAYDYFHLGVSEQNTGDSDGAIAALKKSIELNPTFMEAHRLLSSIFRLTGRNDQADIHAELAKQHEMRMQRLMQKSQ